MERDGPDRDGTFSQTGCDCVATPTQVHDLTGIVDIAAGHSHNLALKSDGTVWAWGFWSDVGTGSEDSSCSCVLSAVQIPNLSSVTTIAAGYSLSLARKSDGTLWAWGDDFDVGAVGTGSATSSVITTPTQVVVVHNVVTMAAGWHYGLVLEGDGSVWSWGDNLDGQLGVGSSDEDSHPTPRLVLSDSPDLTNYDRLHPCAACSANTAAAGGPINVVGGNSWLQQQDIALPGIGLPLDLTRTYNSVDPTDIGFGVGWSYPFGMSVSQPSDSTRLVRYPDSRRDLYSADRSGGFTPPAGTHNTLTQANGGPAQSIYADALAPGWYTSLSWDATVDTANTTPVDSGSNSISYTPTARWAGLQLANDNHLDTTGYTALRFAVRATDDGEPLAVYVRDANWTNLSSPVPLFNYAAYPVASGWTIYTIPLVDLNAVDTSLESIVIHDWTDAAEATVYIDDIQLVNVPRVISGDGLAGGWYTSLSWDATLDTNNTSPVHSGSTSISYTATAGWSGLQLANDNHVNTTGYSALQFAVRSTDDDEPFAVYVRDATWTNLSSPLPLANYGGYPRADGWTIYTIPLADLNAVNVSLESIVNHDWSASAQPAIFIDDIRLVHAADDGSSTLTAPNHVVYAFNPNGKLVSETDRNGNTLTVRYDSTGVTVTAPGGRGITLSYGTGSDAHRFVTMTENDDLSRTVSYDYNAAGDLTGVTNVSAGTTTMTYDADHQLLTVTDPRGHTLETNVYDDQGRVTQQTDAGNGVLTFNYDRANQQTTVTDARDHDTTYHYDDQLRITSVTDPDENTVSYSYDSDNNLVSTIDGRGIETDFTYDAAGNRLTRTVDPGGLDLVSTFTYDGSNNLLTSTDPLTHTITNTYDGKGNLATTTDALNHSTTYGYDGLGELTSITDPLNRTTTLGYDSAGNLTTITDPLNKTTTMGYDDAGRLTSITDALSHTTTLAYNDFDQVASVTDPLSHVVSYTYDADGNRTSVTDADSQTTTYTYDALNRVATATDALSRATTYTYDADGNPTEVEDGNGVTNRSVYDNANRPTGIDLNNDTTLDIQYSYDDADRRTSMIDGTGTTTYSYDDANRLTSVTAPTTGTVSYGYDNANERTSLTYPSSNAVTYSYTDRGQLATVTDWLSHTTTYSYDDAGRLTGIADPNNVVGTLGYNNANQLTSLSYALSSSVLESLSYTLDPAGIVTDLVDNSGTTHYDYDALQRLTEVDYPNSDEVDYGYDAVGNRTSLTLNGSTTTNTFDAANELTASGTDSYSYDDNGNLTSKTVSGVTTTYGYDALNELTSLSGPTSASYSYNGDGLRVSKTVGTTTTDYTWDPTGLGQVINDGNAYVWGLGLISQIASGTPTYAHSDGLGSTRFLTDGGGSVVGTQEYDAFGATRSQTGVQLPFTYTGEQVDPESGLVYLRNRYYDPTTGRFLTPDPLGFVGSGVNLYAYVDNRPVNGTDPSGLDDALLGAGGGFVGGVGGGSGESFDEMLSKFPAEDVTELPGGVIEINGDPGAESASEVGGQICPYQPDEAGSRSASEGAPRFIANRAGEILDTTRITIPEGKFGYLLDPSDKGGIFAEKLGFDSQSLGPALQQHLIDNFENATEGGPMKGGGEKFVVNGPLTGPNGVTRNVQVIWGVDSDGTVRLITAY